MTLRGALLAITAAAITLVSSGCEDMTGTGDEPTTLPHHGTWYFADPDPDDDVPVPPDSRLILKETEFTLAMGDDMGTEFMLFDTPGVTRFEVTGTYMIGADGSVSFTLSDEDVIVEPNAVKSAIALEVRAAVAALSAATSAMLMIDPLDLNRVTISGDFLPELLNLPDVTEVSACKGAPCSSS